MLNFAPKNSDMSIKGVITGDIVDSTSIPLEKRAGLLECMSSVLDDIKQSYSLNYEYFRGDSVQIVVDNPSDSLVVSVLFRIKGQDRKETFCYVRCKAFCWYWYD